MSEMVCQVRPGAYYDSVVLMQLQRALADLPRVVDAGVVMATPANKELLQASDMWPAGDVAAQADDLLIVVKGEDEAAAQAALGQVDELLQRRRSTVTQTFRPRSLASAVKQLPQADWVLISVPGRYAAGVARQALDLNKHVFLYSDNVSLADEVALKQEARQKGLLLMGPDCGTAIVNGVGLGFANRVRRGDIGLVGASGTGLQAITSHIHNLGGGVSQALGTGGRDLKSEVGAVTAHQAVELLGRDPETSAIVLVSKPPAPDVAARLLAAARATGKPVVVDFIGYPPPGRRLGGLHFARTLREAAELAVELARNTAEAGGQPASGQGPAPMSGEGYVRGLFSGGTLAYEVVLGLQATLWPLYSNVPLTAEQALTDPLHSQAHTILDMGADIFTQGRLHPMLDNDLRLRRLQQEAADPETGLILLDVVLGEGAHPDPAAELAPAIAALRQERERPVVAIVLGTDEDPQDVAGQVEQLEAAGAMVFRSASEAVVHVSQMYGVGAANAGETSVQAPVPLATLEAPLAAINVGLESFFESMQTQDAEVVHVDWRPPAGGNEKLMDLLARMKAGPAANE